MGVTLLREVPSLLGVRDGNKLSELFGVILLRILLGRSSGYRNDASLQHNASQVSLAYAAAASPGGGRIRDALRSRRR